MSGEVRELAPLAANIAGQDQWASTVIHDVCDFLLWKQFVVSDLLPDQAWHVRRGSGMGLSHSGPLADAVLAVSSEDRWAADPGVLSRHAIRFYGRFRDDIFIVCDNKELCWEYFLHWKRISYPFELELVEVSRSAVSMSQLTISKNGCSLRCAPKWKENAMHSAPLCTSSAHPAHVHSRWPQGVIRSLGSISSTALDAEGAKAIFLSRLRKFHYSDCFLRALHACPTVQLFPPPNAGRGDK